VLMVMGFLRDAKAWDPAATDLRDEGGRG
jgi:hypothetical protein